MARISAVIVRNFQRMPRVMKIDEVGRETCTAVRLRLHLNERC